MSTSTHERGIDHASFIYKYIKAELIFGACVSLLVAISVGAKLPSVFALGWLCSALILYIGRYLISQRFENAVEDTDVAAKWRLIFIAGVAATGLSWGFLGLVASHAPLSAASGLALFCIACVAASTVSIYAGLSSAVFAFAVPALLPAGLVLAATGTTVEALAGAMLCMIAVLLPLASRPLKRMLVRLWSLQRQHDDLQAEFDAMRHETERLQLTLKNTAKRRELAEVELAGTSGELDTLRLRAHSLQATLERVSPMCPVTGLANQKAFIGAVDNE